MKVREREDWEIRIREKTEWERKRDRKRWECERDEREREAESNDSKRKKWEEGEKKRTNFIAASTDQPMFSRSCSSETSESFVSTWCQSQTRRTNTLHNTCIRIMFNSWTKSRTRLLTECRSHTLSLYSLSPLSHLHTGTAPRGLSGTSATGTDTFAPLLLCTWCNVNGLHRWELITKLAGQQNKQLRTLVTHVTLHLTSRAAENVLPNGCHGVLPFGTSANAPCRWWQRGFSRFLISKQRPRVWFTWSCLRWQSLFAWTGLL